MEIAGGQRAGVLRIGLDVGGSPLVLFVEVVPERVVNPLPAWRGDIEAFPRAKLDAGGDDVDVVAVVHGQVVVLVGLQPGEGHLLELGQHLLFLLLRGPVGVGPRDHRATVAVLEC